MSYTEPTADGGQPQQGQAEPAAGDQPYADYLARVPEEVRGDIQPIFHEWNANVNRRFEDAASYRKQWEPYEQAGINQYPAETLKWALDTLQNPQQAREWLDQQYGPVAPQEAPQEPVDPYGYQDPNAQLQELLQKQLSPLQQQIEQITQWRQEQEQQAMQQQINDAIYAEIDRLHGEHKASLPEGLQKREAFADLIDRFGGPHAVPGADPVQVVQKAWADFQALSNQLSTAALQTKVDQPATPVTGGAPAGAPESPKTLAEANKIALAQWRANQAA